MAEVAELSQWAEGLGWAQEQWEKVVLQEEPINIDEKMQGSESPVDLRSSMK